MIRINIYTIGTLKEKYLKEMSLEFLKRLQKFTKISVLEFEELDINRLNSYKDINDFLEKEDKIILSKIKPNDYLIVLDLHGKALSSEDFAKMIEDVSSTLRGDLNFVIGGTLGVSNSLRERANFSFKISDLTFTHQITRVILLEQIYRAFKIINHEAYHH